MTTIDTATFFNQTLPQAYARDPAGGRAAAPYKYSVEVAGVGDWTVDGTVPSCMPGKSSGLDVTRVSADATSMQAYLEAPRKNLAKLSVVGQSAELLVRVIVLARIVEFARSLTPPGSFAEVLERRALP